jgi:hypothetical protein
MPMILLIFEINFLTILSEATIRKVYPFDLWIPELYSPTRSLSLARARTYFFIITKCRQLFLYFEGLIPTFSLKYFPKND